MMRVIIFIIFSSSFLYKKSEGQNLIINGDFEQCTDCPVSPGQLELCSNWYIPNHSTPDLFMKCHNEKRFFNTPLNAFGYQKPKSGVAYAGFVIVDGVYRNYREYIQGELIETLNADSLYIISFYISWADYSNYFCDRIGYLFTNKKIEPGAKLKGRKRKKNKKDFEGQESLKTSLPKSYGFVSLNFETIKDRGGWHKLDFRYLAKGGEKFITLGLFEDNATEEDYHRFTTQVYGKPNNVGAAAYFYIDDISVTKLKTDFTYDP